MAGSVSVKVEPTPGSLSTSTSPPMSVASRREMARPSPVPPKRRVVELSAWLNSVNSRAMPAASMPMPESRTARRSRGGPAASACIVASIRTKPLAVNFSALPTRFSRIWWTRRPSPSRRLRYVGVGPGHQLEPLVARQRAQQRGHVVHGPAWREGHGVDAHPAGLELGEIEDVVDDGEQRLTRSARGVEVLALSRLEPGLIEQRHHPDHAVHRRADLVAHRRQEAALGRRGLFRLAPGVLQLPLDPRLAQRVVPQLRRPEAAHRHLEQRDAEMEEQLPEADRPFEEVHLDAGVLEDREGDVLADDQERAEPGRAPVLVGDQHRRAGEEEEVHLRQAVQLVDVQRDERLQRGAGDAPRHQRPRRQPGGAEEHRQGQRPDGDGHGPRVVERRQGQADEEVQQQEPADVAIGVGVDAVHHRVGPRTAVRQIGGDGRLRRVGDGGRRHRPAPAADRRAGSGQP